MTFRRRASGTDQSPMREVLTLTICILVLPGCQPNESILKSTRNDRSVPTETLAPRKTSFEQDLADMKDAGFDYIFVIRRKDAKAFEDEDRKFLRESMPHEINRRVSSDDGKAFIFGSGFAIDIKSVETWRKRFIVTEHSKPVEKIESQR